MKTLLAVLLLLQAAPAQSAADKLEAAFKKFGDRTYELWDNRLLLGTVQMKIKVETVDGKRVAVIENLFTWDPKGKPGTLLVREVASLADGRLLSASQTRGGSNGTGTLSITREETKFRFKAGEMDQLVEAPAGAVGEATLLRLLSAAEQKKGAELKVDNLVLGHVRNGYTITCMGKEEIEVGGKKTEAYKWVGKGEFTYTDKQKGREVSRTEKVDETYWISPDGHLLKHVAMEGFYQVILAPDKR